VQTWGVTSDEMWKNGVALASYDKDVIVVKVPGTFEGIKAANALVADGIRVTITAAYASHQAVLAAAVVRNSHPPHTASRDCPYTVCAYHGEYTWATNSNPWYTWRYTTDTFGVHRARARTTWRRTWAA